MEEFDSPRSESATFAGRLERKRGWAWPLVALVVLDGAIAILIVDSAIVMGYAASLGASRPFLPESYAVTLLVILVAHWQAVAEARAKHQPWALPIWILPLLVLALGWFFYAHVTVALVPVGIS